MAYFDINRILNESPKKRLIIGFENLKNNFNESAAIEYANLYNTQPLSFILENSRMIFSEPYHGYQFYKENVCNGVECCAFHKYHEEKDKVLEYIKENENKMSEKQLGMYQELANDLQNKIDSLKHTIMLVEYANIDDTFKTELSDLVYECAHSMVSDNQDVKAKVIAMMESVDDRAAFFAYAPYVAYAVEDASVIHENMNKYFTEVNNESDVLQESFFKEYSENGFILASLMSDRAYMEAVSNIGNKFDRLFFTNTANQPMKTRIEDLVTESVSSVETYYATPMNAVNSIFEDDYDSQIFKEDNDAFKAQRLGLQKIAYESLLDLIAFEYGYTDSDASINGYNYFNENTTVINAYESIANKIIDIELALESSDDEDEDDNDDEETNVDDDDALDAMEKKLNAKYDSHETDSAQTGKKPVEPKPKNLANKIQFSAMDAEAKQLDHMSKSKQHGEEIKNAAKAVAQLPKNFADDIKGQLKSLDDMDDQRRKKFLAAPGFRHKTFKNLKLALMYGTVAQIHLAYLPFAMFCRHLSKEKDRRIRNELLAEIETEIKICDEKINDASAADDKKAKYKLMRIKSKLENERLRVRTNSRYI